MHLFNVLISVFIYYFLYVLNVGYSPSLTQIKHELPHRSFLFIESKFLLEINQMDLRWAYSTFCESWQTFSLLIMFGLCLIMILFSFLISLVKSSDFVPFNTNLTVYAKRKNSSLSIPWMIISILLLDLLFCLNPDYLILQMSMEIPTVINLILNMVSHSRKSISKCLFFTLTIFIFTESILPVAHILSILVFQVSCNVATNKIPLWLPLFLILLANDVEINPGPHSIKNNLSFMNWNLNSLVKGNFERIPLIEAHNSIYDYDIISMC